MQCIIRHCMLHKEIVGQATCNQYSGFPRSCNTVPSRSRVARMRICNSVCEKITIVYACREVRSRRLLLPSTVIRAA